MEVNIVRIRSRFMLFILTIALVAGGQTWAQSSTLDFEKARLVSQFAKHVSWPAEARQPKFIIGVYKDVDKYEYFSDFFANKGIKGKDIVVRSIKDVDEARDVNVLYVSSLSNKRNVLTLAKKMSGSHVLVITEDNRNSDKSMVDISYNKQKSKMNFEVDYSNIIDEKLMMPELSYFLDEKNNQKILSVSPSFVLKNKQSKQLLALQNIIAQQKSSLDQLNKKLNVSKESSEKYNFVLEKHSERLKEAQKTNVKKTQEIKYKAKQLQRLEKQLQAQETQLKMNKQNLPLVDETKAKQQEQLITDLTANLKNQKKITNNTAIKLTDMTKKNESLSSFQMLFYVFVILTLIALLLAYMMWNKSKNAALQPTLLSENKENPLLSVRENQLVKSENIAALGYIASDITYSIGLSLDDLQAQLESTGDTKNTTILKPVIKLLEDFNLIAADQDETNTQRFDVIAYAKKMMMLYDFEFKQSAIVYNYSGEKELMIKSVPSYIALALLNVINNSLKHGFDNAGKGEIALKIEKEATGGAKITYVDDGNGMSKSTLEQIFNPFFTTRSDRGYVGIGMSTTYDLIKNKLAGDIKIDSQEGKGTSVIITLP